MPHPGVPPPPRPLSQHLLTLFPRMFRPLQLLFRAFWGGPRSAVSGAFVDIVGRLSVGCRALPVRVVNLTTSAARPAGRSTCLQSPICCYLAPCSRRHSPPTPTLPTYLPAAYVAPLTCWPPSYYHLPLPACLKRFITTPVLSSSVYLRTCLSKGVVPLLFQPGISW